MTATRTILSIAYPLATVGPNAVGGAEQVLATVEAGLARRAYRSVVVAHADSTVSGKLYGVQVPSGEFTDGLRSEVERRTQAAIDHAVAHDRVDLIHLHGIDFHRYRLPSDVPILATLHLPLDWYPPAIWQLPANVHLQCVSENQRATSTASQRSRLLVVPNGVPLPTTPAPRPRGYALLIGRICPEKNLHTAMDAARAARVPLLLAGRVYPYPEHVRYFREEISPRLGHGARFLGPVGGPAKQRLLAGARCLLVPSLAAETSSLVAMEAAAAGTPVIAFPNGALPEVVQHGVTGLLVGDEAAMTRALQISDTLDRHRCREHARRTFNADDMVSRYLSLYEDLLH